MTTEQINDCFKNHLDKSGIPGTILQHYIRSFKAFIEQLNSYEDVSITHLKLFPKSRDTENMLSTFETYHKIKIDDEIKSFYDQTDGLQLRWLNKKHPRFDKTKDGKFYKKPFDMSMVDTDKGKARFINILPFEYFLSDTLNGYLNFKNAEGYHLYFFNYNHFRSNQVLYNLNKPNGTIDLYFGVDDFSFVYPMNMSFAAYMQSLLVINDELVAQAAIE